MVFEDVASAQKVLDFDGHYISGKKVAIRNYRKNVKNAKGKAGNHTDHNASHVVNNLAYNEDEDEEVDEIGEYDEEDDLDEAEFPVEPFSQPANPTGGHAQFEAAEECTTQVYQSVRPSQFVEQSANRLQTASEKLRSRCFGPPNSSLVPRPQASNLTEPYHEADECPSIFKSYSDHLRSMGSAPADQQLSNKHHALYRFNSESSLQLLRRRIKLEVVMNRRAHLYGSYYGL